MKAVNILADYKQMPIPASKGNYILITQVFEKRERQRNRKNMMVIIGYPKSDNISEYKIFNFFGRML